MQPLYLTPLVARSRLLFHIIAVSPTGNQYFRPQFGPHVGESAGISDFVPVRRCSEPALSVAEWAKLVWDLALRIFVQYVRATLVIRD